jgi:putative transposase
MDGSVRWFSLRPETVVRWHRTGFKLYWKWLSRHRTGAGRRCVSRELREFIFRMVAENPTWGAPRIHGELKILGFDISCGATMTIQLSALASR